MRASLSWLREAPAADDADWAGALAASGGLRTLHLMADREGAGGLVAALWDREPAAQPPAPPGTRWEWLDLAAEVTGRVPGPFRAARTSLMVCTLDALRESVRPFREEIGPRLAGRPGFGWAGLMMDPGGGRRLTLSLWSSPADLDGSEALAGPFRASLAEELGAAGPPEVRRFGIVLSLPSGRTWP